MKTRSLIFLLALALPLFATSIQLVASEGTVQWEALPKPGVVELFYDEGVDPETRLFFQTLKVEVKSATPSTMLSVYVKGKYLGDLYTNMAGNAEFEIEREEVQAGSDGRPVKRINTGDVCEIVSGTRTMIDTFEIVPATR